MLSVILRTDKSWLHKKDSKRHAPAASGQVERAAWIGWERMHREPLHLGLQSEGIYAWVIQQKILGRVKQLIQV